MRKNLIISQLLSVSFFLSGCINPFSYTYDDTINLAEQPPAHAEETITHMQKNTLSYGTYQGLLPCTLENCNGLATMLVLYPDNRYLLRTRHLGRDVKDSIKKGHFSRQTDGSVVLDVPFADGKVDRLSVGYQTLLMPQLGVDNVNGQSVPYALKKTGEVPNPGPNPHQ